MKTYARVQFGIVAEIIPPMVYEIDSPVGVMQTWKTGDEIPIERRYTPEFVAMMVDITGMNPQPAQFWSYDGKVFSAPSMQAL